MKIKTSELTLLALDWAVTRANYEINHETVWEQDSDTCKYSTDWAQGGPIIEREGIAVDVIRAGWTIDSWVAALVHEDREFDGVARAEEYGPTPLIAAMRCYVASVLGDEVEIPEELL